MELPIQDLTDIQNMANAFKSRRLRILKALQAILKTITVANGYTKDIQDVRMDTKSWRDVSAPETPIIFLVDDQVQITRFAGRTREYVWTIRLFGVVKETTLDEFEEFIADVESCVEDNNHLAGIVNKCEINQVITDNGLFDNTNTRLFELELKCEFVRQLQSPR
jgi:uncharacterized protein YkvS